MAKGIVTFGMWLEQFENEDSPRGEFYRFSKKCIGIMGTKRDIKTMLKYLGGADEEQLKLFDELYKEYESTHKEDIRKIGVVRRYMKKNKLGLAEVIAEVMGCGKR